MARINKTLPIGTAVFPKLTELDVYQPMDSKGRPSGEPKKTWNTRIKFAAEDHRAVEAWLASLLKDAGIKNPKNSPWKTDKKTGEITLMVSSGEAYKPAMFDAKNKKLPEDIKVGGGTQLRVNVNPFVYEGLGGGVKLYLNAVQIIKLVSGGMGASPFDEEEGFEAPASTNPFEAGNVEISDDDAF